MHTYVTRTQIEQKIAEYDTWLVENPTARDRPLVEASKRDWEYKLSQLPPHLDIEVKEPEVLTHDKPPTDEPSNT